MEHIYYADYCYGQPVYLRTDPEQLPRIVTRHVISNTEVQYEVTCGTQVLLVQGIELSEDKNLVLHL